MTDLILIIEDDRELSDIIKSYLLREGYAAIQAFDGQSGAGLIKSTAPKLVLLDIMLPGLDGIELLKQLREASSIPVIVISAKSSESDKLLMLGLGADDYITKPFSMREMTARVASQLRREHVYNNNQNDARVFGKLKIYPQYYKVTAEEKEIQLTSKEFKLLDFLSSNKGKVFTKAQLMDNVWGYDGFVDEGTVTVCVARLREKLSAHGIGGLKTVWGVGYKWQE